MSGTEIAVNATLAGPLSRYVGGASGDELRVRVRCSGGNKSFTTSADLLRIDYKRL